MAESLEEKPVILLLNPPFGEIGSPYIGIPVLAAYLRSRNIAVSAFDINRAFYVKLLSPENIIAGKRHGERRFKALDNKPVLTFSEMFEYRLLAAALTRVEALQEEYARLLLPFADFSLIQESKARELFIQLALLPHYPQMLLLKPRFKFTSSCDTFASADILRCAHHKSFYTALFETIIKELLARANPRIIGLSVVFENQVLAAFQCARIVKSLAPHIHVTMGGPFISIHLRQVKERKLFEIVDSLVIDEGEIPLERLYLELSRKSPHLAAVPGLIYPDGEDIRRNEPVPAPHLEKAPPPDYTVFQLDGYLNEKEKLCIPFRLSKGCSWRKCTFCRTHLPLVSACQQPAYDVIYNQLRTVIEHTGIHLFHFSDESAHPRLLAYISRRLIRENIKIKWYAHTRISRGLTGERCRLFREAGCVHLALGLESLHPRILKGMKKGITVNLIEEVLGEIKCVVPITAYMIIGFPGESEDEALAGYHRIRLFKERGWITDYVYNLLTILYGSDLWAHPQKYGIAEMLPAPNQDLMPDICHFKGSGMSRDTAFRLFLRFNKGPHPPAHTVTYNAEPLNYSLTEIEEKIEARWDIVYLPFIQWLKKGSETVTPTAGGKAS
jgi:anaerobic magnesium-protoporphyrin IX monomethyl ester cyclase